MRVAAELADRVAEGAVNKVAREIVKALVRVDAPVLAKEIADNT